MQNQIKITNNSMEVYQDGGVYINQLKLYHAYFNTVPNLIKVPGIDNDTAINFIILEMKNQIEIENYCQKYDKVLKTNRFHDYFVILKNNLFINIFEDNVFILFQPKEEAFAKEFQNRLIPLIKRVKRTKDISLIISNRFGLSTKEIEIKKPILDFDLHYNDDFKLVHQTVLKTLRKPKTKGLFLFHGIPGTGKSTYIKYLIHRLNKQVIFLSPKMAANLDNISFTEFLLDNPNIILVIEDAEDLITSRDNHQNSQLSFLLNLTDGLIADSLGIQIIATFNTDLKNIDKALLRKGRLTAIYEFKELEIQKVNNLAKSLKIEDFETFQPMVLADIFNFQETNFTSKKEKAKIGF